MSAIGLPVNLGAVAAMADTRDSGGRFGLKAVRVEVRPQEPKLVYGKDGMGPPLPVEQRPTYRVAATDTKRLIVVEGECEDTDTVPGLAAVHAAPNSATAASIPLALFKKTFADAAKATARMPAFRQVLTSLAPHQVTLGYTNGEVEQVQAAPLLAERFPPVDDILKTTRKKPVKAKFAVDPKMLAEVLKTLASFCDDESMRVEVEVREETGALILTAGNAGQKVTALVMPLGK